MLELPHIIVGAAMATKIPNPLISLPLAFLVHFPLDLIPHWNPHLYQETKKYGKPTKKTTLIVVADLLLSLGAGFFLAARVLPDINHAFCIILACFAAVALDVIEGPYFFLNFRPQWLRRLIEFQHRHQGRALLVPGLIVQVTVVILGIVIALS